MASERGIISGNVLLVQDVTYLMVAEALGEDMRTHLKIASNESATQEFAFDMVLALLGNLCVQRSDLGLMRSRKSTMLDER
jgi:hypothetical protein